MIETVDEHFGADLLRVDSESPAVKTIIDNRQIEGLPLDGRNFYELTLLVPGAVPPAPGSAGSVRGDFSFSVNGAREDSNNFLLDGVYNVDPKLNTFAVRPPVDAIREFEIATSTYDAAFGRNPGAQVNVVLKSGSNDFHGSLYEFHRNAALDARNFFAPGNEPAPKYIRNQFGVSFGGPIRKDRTFFFADYEGTRAREGITRVTNVPTLPERSGDFSQKSAWHSARSVHRAAVARWDDSVSFSFTRLGARSRRFIRCRIATAPFANFVSSPTQRDDNDHFDARVDHFLSRSRQRWCFVTALVIADSLSLLPDRLSPPFPAMAMRCRVEARMRMVGLTHVFSPKLVNDARFAFNRVASAVNQENQGTSINRAVGLPELSDKSARLRLELHHRHGLFAAGP